ncbi:MAG: creatininase family protein [Gemmatimonadaceae bacterium]|nr:creatininase family protein [Gemmatimonadaceae bacterium]HPV76868.1 creatininase family protein [Gemmatimonadaceae bacterium]
MPPASTGQHAPLRLKELRPGQVAEAIARDPRLLIPVGTCEQHGPHLPMGVDTIIVEHLADDLSAELRVLRAPTVEYGVNTDHERTIPGNATLRRKTLLRALNDLTDAWEAGGIREFVFLTAHGHEGHQEALSTVITKGARVRVVDILAIDLSDLTVSGLGPLHGDEVDTSLLLHLAPDLVVMEKAQDYMITPEALRRYRRPSLRVPAASAGSIGRPSLASAEKGKAIYARIYSRIRDRIFLAPAPADD